MKIIKTIEYLKTSVLLIKDIKHFLDWCQQCNLYSTLTFVFNAEAPSLSRVLPSNVLSLKKGVNKSIMSIQVGKGGVISICPAF